MSGTAMVLFLWHALLIGYLPGMLLLRLPGRSRTYRAGLPPDERAFWAVVLSLTWSLGLVLGLAALERYTFGRLLTSNAIGCVILLAAFRERLLRPAVPDADRVRGGRWVALVPVGLVALGAVLYFPPSEYVIGGRDPGAYISEGVQIAQRGSLVIHDPVVSAVPEAVRDISFPWHGHDLYYSLRFMGFFIQDPAAGTVMGQFPHLYPASVAIGYGLNGLSGARQAGGVWAVLGLLAVFFTASTFVGRRAAALAAALVAVNVVTVWFGRYPNSEVVMVALLFAALLAFHHATREGRIFFAWTSGWLLGFLLFLRYEVVLAFISVGAAAVLLPVVRRRMSAAFGVGLVISAAAGFWYLQGPQRAYFWLPLLFTKRYWWVVLLAGSGLLATAWILLARDGVRRAVERGLPPLLAAGLTGLAIYAYFFRQQVGLLALGDAMAFRSFGWYVTPWVLGVASVGAAALFVRRFWQAPAFFLTFTVFSVFFFYKTRVVPEHFWAARRFLTMILPGSLIFTAALADGAVTWALGHVASLGVRPKLRGALTTLAVMALLAPVAVVFWRQSAPVRHHVEYAGVIPQLEALAGRIGDRDLLLVESRNAGSDLHVFSMPLAYIYARNVLELASPAPARELTDAFMAWARTRYDRIFFLGGGGTELLTPRLEATPIASVRFQVPEYDAPTNAYPSGPRIKKFGYGLYRIDDARARSREPLEIEVGGLDDLQVLRFHAHEQTDDGVKFRWTTSQSFIVLPARDDPWQEVTLWLSTGGRPLGADPAVLEVAVADEVVGTVTPTEAFRPYTFAIPPSLAGRIGQASSRVRLRVSTWNPLEQLRIADGRNLGVRVSRVVAR